MSLWVRMKGAQNEGLYRHSVTGIYKFRKYREGKGEVDRSLKTSDLTIARRRRSELMAELWGDAPKFAKRKTAGELWPGWQAGKTTTKSKGTASSINATWKNLEPFIFNMFLDEITETWWLNTFIPDMRERPHPVTKKANPGRKFMNDRKWLLAFLKAMKRAGHIVTVPELVNPDPVRARAEVFTDDEFERLFECADYSMMAKLVMGRDHFMRRSEIALLEKAWIDRENRIIRLPAAVTKIRKERSFPYSETLETLFLILDEASKVDSPYVFPSPGSPEKSILRDGFNRSWKSLKARARVPIRKKFHWLRHTGLTSAFKRQRLSAALICHFAGLSLEEAERTYLHFTVDDLRGVENLVGGL